MNCCRLSCIILTVSMLFMLSGCDRNRSANAFPPQEETVKAAVKKIGWTLDANEIQSWEENQIIYVLENEEQMQATVSCALIDGNRILTENCTITLLPDKPQFTWEKWKETLFLAEDLYGGFDEGELYQSLSAQRIPDSELPAEGFDESTGQEVLTWEVECSAGYGRVRWVISPVTVEHSFSSSAVQNWRESLSISLYESKNAYEVLGKSF